MFLARYRHVTGGYKSLIQFIKLILTSIGRAQTFIILSVAYYLLFLPFCLVGRAQRQRLFSAGWHEVTSQTLSLEEAQKQ